ncbi:Peptidoglycan/xylan/chitin deacetylase, PgdA/CDA1 family [Cnuella takakiae]|uniref:Peptidoglycan/xylan/chitin deacetylase, PgdA/CDA1 family n=1 Tax=Cnuella takakiae TaxID=1302690 RepID=A0A1M5BSB6_9BACT|nr:polysaccharide deacetylase family protein [Cnuella takakiae]SHF45290.1 Peptidoglycan/xylan/chitin deacetylase, PgdA/CDA1 family [Cnuella takakiae]
MKRFLLYSALALATLPAFSQGNGPWRGKKAAVVLTYDDAIDQHLDNALPLIDSLGLKATFYVSGFSNSMQKRLNAWKAVATKGHELGNHTMYHPCIGNTPGRSWVKPDYDLSKYTVQRIVDETRATNLLLQSMDGKTRRTFAFPCSDTHIGDSAYIQPMQGDFVAARAVRNQMHRIGEVALYDVDCFMVNNHTAEQMIAWVKEAVEKNALLVILFHGVGGGNSLDVALPEHRRFLQYLKGAENDLWIAPMVEVADFVRGYQQREAVNKATQADYNKMLAQLGIQATRRGPSGNPQAPDAANSDEAKATTYTSIPDALVLKNGKKVTSTNDWWRKRRPEIVADFDREIYGRVPANIPGVKWEVISVKDTSYGSIAAVEKQLLGHVDNSMYPQIKVDIQLTLTTPKSATKAVPVVMEYGFVWPPGFRPPAPPAGTTPPKSWQEQVLERGLAAALLIPTSYQADHGAGLTEGIIGLVNKGQPRKPDDWGTLRAWAWGASRAIDYFESDPAIDAKQVAIEGLSRYGKAALVAMAYEPRIKIGFIGSSGAGGAKILRRTFGEQVENLASSAEYHWFAGNFIKYAGPLTPNDLPVDAHELIALCAPRPVFISSGSPQVEGNWIDAKGMFLGGVHAGPVYRLLGKKDLGTAAFPAQETNLATGDIAFRQHSGGHTTGPNWPYFLDFASRYFK